MKARHYQTVPGTTATVFDVYLGTRRVAQVDLDAGDGRTRTMIF